LKWAWKELTVDEFKVWLGLYFLMGQNKLRSLEEYWRGDNLLSHETFRQCMSKHRFKMISSMLRFSDHAANLRIGVADRNSANFDPFNRVRRLWVHMFQRFRDAFSPDQIVCLGNFSYNLDRNLDLDCPYLTLTLTLTLQTKVWYASLGNLAISNT